ncbi:LAMI_0C06194g1_1 [Lachancea mirantina]|uniref:LAMI_0C06194g1_1 n=1 Tax=Lachancea mirantina TaxID=1230905 RepID=A0A1G4J3Q7_9SACH|nr:LAMI_0C06194g1_1 [Lachancea mirantina]
MRAFGLARNMKRAFSRSFQLSRHLHMGLTRLNEKSSSIASLSANLTKPGEKGAIADLKDDLPGNFIDKLPEQLISEGNGLKSTRAEHQVDTLKYYDELLKSGFTPQQSKAIIQLLLESLNEEFFEQYNVKFLRNMELENQSHLFNAAETEVKFAIQNSRETALNEQNLKLLKLNRDLQSMHDDLNELIINLLKKDSRVDFNDHKTENTLQQRSISLDLKDCNNKIGTKIIGNVKSEIENLRWQTTRSGLFAVIILVFFIMSGVSISKRISVESEKPVEVILHTIEPEESEATGWPEDPEPNST